MAAPGGGPGGPGNALAVAAGQYSHAGAIAILTRELQGEDVQKLDQIHQGIINLITPMQAMPWKTLVRGLLQLSDKFIPVNYLLPTPASERCLKDLLRHACMTACLWQSGSMLTGSMTLAGTMSATMLSAPTVT